MGRAPNEEGALEDPKVREERETSILPYDADGCMGRAARGEALRLVGNAFDGMPPYTGWLTAAREEDGLARGTPDVVDGAVVRREADGCDDRDVASRGCAVAGVRGTASAGTRACSIVGDRWGLAA
jgi:hypothetical protein